MSGSWSASAYEVYVRKHANWNFFANMLDLSFYNLALSFIFGTTVLSLYASHLTSSAVLIGLIPAIQSVGFYLPQLVLARHTEQLSRKKPLIVRVSIAERLPYLFVAMVALLWPGAPRGLAYAVLAVSLGLATFSGGLVGPAWQNMLAKVIPAERRGRLFGISNATGGLLGVGGAALSRYVLGAYAYPISFGLCFLFCFGAQIFSYLGLNLNREPPSPPKIETPTAREYFRALPGVLRRDANFGRYLVSRVFIILGTMATTFYILYARAEFQVSDAFAADLTIVALVSQTAFSPLLGTLADRKGHKWATEVCAVLMGGASLLALMAPNPTWMYGVFLLMNAAVSGMMVASLAMTMAFSEPDQVPTYVGLANTLLATPILVTPIIGGWVVDALGYRTLFWAALAFSCVGAAATRWAVSDPGHRLVLPRAANDEAEAP